MYANYTGIRYSGQEKMKDTGTDRDNPIISCHVKDTDNVMVPVIIWKISWQLSTVSIKGL